MGEERTRRLSAYDWPGNVRELENLMERAAILASDGRPRIEFPAGPQRAITPEPAATPELAPVITESQRRDQGRDNIRAALTATGGKVFGPGGAAELLGMKPTTLASRMRSLGVRTEKVVR